MDDLPALPGAELVWFLAWNIADGHWTRISLEETQGRAMLLDLFASLHGDRLEAARNSLIRLQQGLMALGGGSFEEIQRESPFSRYAQRNMEKFIRAFREGEGAFAAAWQQVFAPGWEGRRESQEPLRIVGHSGDSEARALEVKGAPDNRTRVAAEWWYLYRTFGRDWTPESHWTIGGTNDKNAHFSLHHVLIHPDTRKQIFFRLTW